MGRYLSERFPPRVLAFPYRFSLQQHDLLLWRFVLALSLAKLIFQLLKACFHAFLLPVLDLLDFLMKASTIVTSGREGQLGITQGFQRRTSGV
jgi:hypothetical protein